MAIEKLIKDLTAALEANTLALNAQSGKVADKPEPSPSKAETPKPSQTKKEAAPASPSKGTGEPPEVASIETPLDKTVVSKKVIELAKAKGREAAASIMAEYGATKVPEIPADKYAELVAKIDAELA